MTKEQLKVTKEQLIKSIEWLISEFGRTNDDLLLTQIEVYIKTLRNKL